MHIDMNPTTGVRHPTTDIRQALMNIYERLYGHFGPRHWWPADGPFEMIVGAILTQNVTWRSVTMAIDSLKAAGLLSLDGLLAVREEELSPLLRPTRYHIQKARKLQAFCRVVAAEHGGDLDAFLSQEAMDLRHRLLQIYGIGPETADAIVLYAAGKPIFVIDAYTHRIFHRLGYFPERISYREMQSFFMDTLPPEASLYNEYHALIDALGHHTCTARPRCDACPLAGLCRIQQARQQALAGSLER
jgi:endonuclease-3 related protein